MTDSPKLKFAFVGASGPESGTTARPLYDGVTELDHTIASAAPEDARRAYLQLEEAMTAAGHSSADTAALFPASAAVVRGR